MVLKRAARRRWILLEEGSPGGEDESWCGGIDGGVGREKSSEVGSSSSVV